MAKNSKSRTPRRWLSSGFSFLELESLRVAVVGPHFPAERRTRIRRIDLVARNIQTSGGLTAHQV